ncbi:DUF4173 domain-containing protein [Fulvivirgaceae bacterium BMA10]|uniref:DUF4173 domain-containing protein n=1 Tax=Splendidivirga corallicola TaxID=3051826 RepID=A0ABT8KJ35_9BACT|nr:DUF4173 domain-containing protein [Fulvivirgaceae bacterium BMA10]
MKKNDIIIICITILYSVLFFGESAGINFLFFNLVIIGTLRSLHPKVALSSTIVLAMVGSLLSSINIVWHNTHLSVVMNVISIVFLGGVFFNQQNSFFVAGINSFYSFFTSLIINISKKLFTSNNSQPNKSSASEKSYKNILIFLIPVSITILFISLYASANPAFAHLIQYIDLSFISWERIRFTLGGAFLVFSFFRQVQISSLTALDLNTSNFLLRSAATKRKIPNLISLKHEYKTGWILLLMLNIVLLIFNGTDLFHLTVGKLPEGVSYSSYVHQGVNTLIISIILAIAIILYYFRGSINFYKKNKLLKQLGNVWLMQNLVLVATIAIKNSLYISTFGLTQKRIGVYVYLILTVAGLITTFIKISRTKNNWFLIRINTIVFYIVFILGTFFHWNSIITRYNLQYGPQPDIEYLISISDNNLYNLLTINQPDIVLTDRQNVLLQKKKTEFLRKGKAQSFLSWNHNDWQTKQTIESHVEF